MKSNNTNLNYFATIYAYCTYDVLKQKSSVAA